MFKLRIATCQCRTIQLFIISHGKVEIRAHRMLPAFKSVYLCSVIRKLTFRKVTRLIIRGLRTSELLGN